MNALKFITIKSVPAQSANSMFGLVSSIVLVLSACHIQETIHYSYTLVKTLSGKLGKMAPCGNSITRVSP